MTVRCPKCGSPGGGGAVASAVVAAPCGNCGAPLSGHVFRAIDGTRPGAAAASVQGFGDANATCFFCEGETATGECSSCGRFVCDRCKVDWAGAVTCLTCVHAMREVKRDDRFVSGRVIWDNLALSMVLWPALLIPFYGILISVVLAPFSIYFALRHWNSPRGVVPRGRVRLVLALLIAGLFLVGVVVGVTAMVVAIGESAEQVSGQ